MVERLIFSTLIEQEATRELLKDNWASMAIASLGDGQESFILEIAIDADAKLFFKWAYSNHVLIYCYNLSLELFDPPVYMQEALRELKERKLLE